MQRHEPRHHVSRLRAALPERPHLWHGEPPRRESGGVPRRGTLRSPQPLRVRRDAVTDPHEDIRAVVEYQHVDAPQGEVRGRDLLERVPAAPDVQPGHQHAPSHSLTRAQEQLPHRRALVLVTRQRAEHGTPEQVVHGLGETSELPRERIV